MSIPSRNIQKPANPIPKAGYPENRVYQTIGGVTIKVGSVIRVGLSGTDDWWTLGRAHHVRPWEIIYFNFNTYVPEEVNWYLREYVGCRRLGPRRRNYRFDGARPGLILMPWGEAVNEVLIERAKRPKKREDDTLDRRWPKRKDDISVGRKLVEDMLRDTHRQIVEWKPNPADFDVAKEIKGKIFSPGGPKFGFGDLLEGVVKTFKEIDPVHQEVRRIREGIHSSFAAGVGDVIFPGTPMSMAGRSGYERVFYEKGQKYAQRLTKLQRYQLCLGLSENARHYGLQGFNPLPGTKSFYRGRMTESGLVRLIRREFARNKYLFRN